MREDWTYKKLGEIANIICGQDYKSVADPNGDYPIYGTGGIMGYASQYRCPSNSVIIGRKGNINNPIFVDTDFWNVDTAFGIVANKDRLIPKFFYYFAIIYDFTKHDVSVTIPSLRRTDLLKISIPVPPLSEQQRIVSELDLLSSIIEKKKAQLKEYDQLAQSIFYHMFGDPITNEKGWKLKKMGEVCAQKSKIARASKKFTSNSPIEYIDISSVDNISKTITTTTSYIFSEAPSRAQQIVEYGDILISLVRPNLQNIAIVLYNKNNLVGSSGFCVIRTEQQTIKEYLFYVIRSSHFTDFLMQRVSGANYPAVREEDVKSFTLPIPPLSLQQQFASKIEAIEKQKELIKQSITETETLFNSRMDYYFN